MRERSEGEGIDVLASHEHMKHMHTVERRRRRRKRDRLLERRE